MALGDENVTLRHENRNLIERLSAAETTPRLNLCFQTAVHPMQPLMTPELGNSSIQPSDGSPMVHNVVQPVNSELFITSFVVDTALFHAMSARLHALNGSPHLNLQSTT